MAAIGSIDVECPRCGALPSVPCVGAEIGDYHRKRNQASSLARKEFAIAAKVAARERRRLPPQEQLRAAYADNRTLTLPSIVRALKDGFPHPDVVADFRVSDGGFHGTFGVKSPPGRAWKTHGLHVLVKHWSGKREALVAGLSLLAELDQCNMVPCPCAECMALIRDGIRRRPVHGQLDGAL